MAEHQQLSAASGRPKHPASIAGLGLGRSPDAASNKASERGARLNPTKRWFNIR